MEDSGAIGLLLVLGLGGLLLWWYFDSSQSGAVTVASQQPPPVSPGHCINLYGVKACRESITVTGKALAKDVPNVPNVVARQLSAVVSGHGSTVSHSPQYCTDPNLAALRAWRGNAGC